MKTLTILIFLVGCSVVMVGQNSLNGKVFGFDKIKQRQSLYDSLGLGISPEMKRWLPEVNMLSLLDNKNFNKRDNQGNTNGNYYTPIFRMPVAGLPFHSNMPVLVPDSSVTYFIRQKRFNMVNPLDKSDRIHKEGNF